jgi:hypothetical protein
MAMPHVTGASGNIVAILWSPKNALHAPPLPNRGNKILWASRVDGPGPLLIRATLAGSARTAAVSLPDGPGPSYVNRLAERLVLGDDTQPCGMVSVRTSALLRKTGMIVLALLDSSPGRSHQINARTIA